MSGSLPGPALTYRLLGSPGMGLVIILPCPKCRKFVTSAPALKAFGGVETLVRYDNAPVLVSR